MLTGLVSVTFRELSPAEIVRLVRQAGLDGIEWGGDIHCPPGDDARAREVARLTRENGLKVISYGSYYRAGSFGNFEDVLRTAKILETDNIRVWAGEKSSTEASGELWDRIVKDTRRIAEMAAADAIDISFEYHANTLTDELPMAIKLLQDIGMDNVYTYWQPPAGISVEDNIDHLRQLIEMGKLKNLHVFAWVNGERQPLATHKEIWKKYVDAALSANPALLMEFVADNSPAQFLEDAKTLKTLAQEG